MKLKWVKTSEQLPPRPEYHRSGHYLATVDNGQVVAVDWVLVRRKSGAEFQRWEWHGKICPWEVIAWMPLPKPCVGECEDFQETDAEMALHVDHIDVANHFRIMAAAEDMYEALKRAHLFISNGRSFRYIKMPDDFEDPAWETPHIIEQALAKARGEIQERHMETKEARWISVMDKLPEVYAIVLLCDENGNMFTGDYTGEAFEDFYGYDCNGITHWIPLPELPEGVNRDE